MVDGQGSDRSGRLGRERLATRASSIRGGRRGAAPRAARPPGRHDLPAAGPRGDDRRRSDDPEEPAQPASPRPGGPARRPGLPRPRPGRSPPGRCCRPCSPRFSRSEHVNCGKPPASSATVELSVLCRRTDQIEAAVAAGIATIYADYQDIKEYADAVAAARRGGAAIYLATPRIEKPLEANLFRYLAKQGADGILVRNAGGLYFCAERGIPFVADFSLNAANPLTVELFKSPRRRARHGLVRPERRPAHRPDRRRPARLARGRDPSADPHVPHGALRLLCLPLARHRQDELRPAVRPPRRQAPRPGGHGPPAQGRRRLPQHPLQRRAPDRRRVLAPARRRTVRGTCGSSSSTTTRPRCRGSSGSIGTRSRADVIQEISGGNSRRPTSTGSREANSQ